MPHPITVRPMQEDADFWKMRGLLIASAAQTPIGLNWDVRRLDGKRFYNEDLDANRLLDRPVSLWEDAGELVGFILPDGRGDAHLQVHPDYRHLEDEMIAWAEAHLAVPAADGGQRQLEIYVYEYDALRQRLLRARGFTKTDAWGTLRHLRLGRQPLAAPQMAAGYMLRTTRPPSSPRSSAAIRGAFSGQVPDDCQRIADLLNAAFGRTFHNAQEYHNFALHAPCFRRELDLVAEAADGTLAAYVGIPYDPVNRCGIFEPVCTHPSHRRLGLAQALMQEGLLRLRAIGAVEATVDTGNMLPANRLYDSLGFTEAYRGFAWRKLTR
ncbi:MAG: GNAT family N-acetyltransferase [Chloroflexi bacterium]|nr:GNAT family N-acetyltransferase [Chloroflexota bacterium]